MSEMQEYLRPSSKRIVLNKAVIKGNFILKSGAQATEKFEIDQIEDDSEELRLCVNGLVNCIEHNFRATKMHRGNRYTFTALASLATGGTRLGQLVSQEIDMPHVETFKAEDGKLRLGSDLGDDAKLMLLDDVYSSGTSMEELMRSLPSRVEVVGGVAILDRSHGLDIPQLSNGAPVYAAIKEVL